MSLTDELTAGVAEVFGVLGKAATYNGAACSVIVESYAQTMEQSPSLTVADAVIYVRGQEVPQPAKKDVVAWDGVSYVVAAILSGDGQGLTWKLAVNKRVVQ
ncbi:MAG: hypothetical protein ACLGQH_09780 [Acidobacteriota bacterium]